MSTNLTETTIMLKTFSYTIEKLSYIYQALVATALKSSGRNTTISLLCSCFYLVIVCLIYAVSRRTVVAEGTGVPVDYRSPRHYVARDRYLLCNIDKLVIKL